MKATIEREDDMPFNVGDLVGIAGRDGVWLITYANKGEVMRAICVACDDSEMHGKELFTVYKRDCTMFRGKITLENDR